MKFKNEKVTGGFNSNYVNVIIEKVINGNLIQEVAEFVVQQTKSEGQSLILKNDEMDFLEELDFTEDDVIASLKESLKFRGKTKKEKLVTLDKAIKTKSDKINNIKKGYYTKKTILKPDETKEKSPKQKHTIEKVKVNKIDEDRELRLLKVLKEHIIDYDDGGVYEIINIRGLREIRFLLVEDFLYPVYRSPNKRTMFQNMVTKKKVYKVQHDLARQEYLDATKSKISEFFKNALPFFAALIVLFGLFLVYNNGVRGG